MNLYVIPFTQLVEDVMREMREASTETHVEAKYQRLVNRTYCDDIPSEREWDWLRKASTIGLSAYYATGTIDATNASATVAGTDTVWTTSHIGYKIKISGDDHIYEFTYTSGTAGTISPTYYGDTATDMTYTMYKDVYSLPSDFLKFPNDKMCLYQFKNGMPKEIKIVPDSMFLKRSTYQASSDPTWARIYPGKTSAGVVQLQIAPPVQEAKQLEVEYIRALPEMYEVTDTTHASTACTTTKIVTATNLYASISVGQYISGDPSTFGGAREWTRITAVAADTTTGNGITVETMRTALSTAAAITVCDAPIMTPSMQKAIFYGACAQVAAEQNDVALKAYLLAYEKALNLDKSRMARRFYGDRRLQLGNWR